MNQLSVYELEFANPESWEELLAAHPVGSPLLGQRKTIGFLSTEDRFVDHLGGHYAIQGAIAERHLPKDAIDREVRQRLNGEHDEGKTKAAWAEVEQELLANAPIRERAVVAVFDDQSKRLYVFASAKLAEDVILSGLRLALGSVHAIPLVIKEAVQPKLTDWLKTGVLPETLFLGRFAELDTEESTGGKTVFKDQDLSDSKVQQHVHEGDLVSNLELNWNGKIIFRINAKAELKQLSPPECTLKPQHAFNVWPDIMDILPRFYDGLINLLGGTREVGKMIEAKAREKLQAPADVATEVLQVPVPSPTPAVPIKIAVVAFGGDEDLKTFLMALEHVASVRNLGHVLIPEISNPLMRQAWMWAKSKEVPITLVRKSQGEPDTRVHDTFAHSPDGLLMYGRSDEGDQYQAYAENHGVKVLRIQAG